MQNQLTFSFDRLVWFTVATILGLIALVIARGDQIALQPIRFTPAPNTTGISTRAQVQIQFDQPLAPLALADTLHFTPPVDGDLQVANELLRFTPATALAADTTYTVTLAADLRGQQSGRLQQPLSWQFTTGGTQVAYTAIDSTGKEQLFVVDVHPPDAAKASSPPIQLPTGPFSIWDFSVSPVNGQLIYAALKEDGTSDLWSVSAGDPTATPFLFCPNAVCNSSAWSPDGKLLAYARRNSNDFGAAALSPPRLWLFDPTTGETVPVFPDSQKLAFEPTWSADSQWLSYVAPDTGGVGVVNLQSGEAHAYPTTSGAAGSWDPQTNRLLYSKLGQIGDLYVAHLMLADPVRGEERNVSGESALVDDDAPAWSPDGARIAFRRKELRGPGATPGKQIWLMHGDGTEAQPLTADPAHDHSAPLWSPDGRYLLFHKLPLHGPDIILSVWVLDVETGESWKIAEPGQRPQWIP